ncbi:MAG: YbhB/YbcL family Raf kinase inhibitor-like protein [Pseudomonadota bacterium]
MRVALALMFAITLAGCGQARPAPKALSHDLVGAIASPSRMTVASGAIGADGKIGARYSAYGANLSPALEWSPVAGARSYAVILEDPDAPAPRPWSHWLIWNIAPAETSLPEGVPLGAAPNRPPGAAQGRGDAGDVGYFGPKPPGGTHHYHFEVFALDRVLALAGGADRDALLTAMRGHVLAWGELIGTFAAP